LMKAGDHEAMDCTNPWSQGFTLVSVFEIRVVFDEV